MHEESAGGGEVGGGSQLWLGLTPGAGKGVGGGNPLGGRGTGFAWNGRLLGPMGSWSTQALSLSLGEAAQAVFLLGTYSFCRPDRAYSCQGVTSGLGPPTQAGQGKQVLGPQRGRLWGNWGDTSTLDHNTTSTGSLGRAWAESPGGHQQQERNNHYPLGQERGCGHWRGC